MVEASAASNRGQIYLARTVGELAEQCIERCVYHVLAAKREDVEPRLRYSLDLSRYVSFKVVWIEKVGQIRRVGQRLYAPGVVPGPQEEGGEEAHNAAPGPLSIGDGYFTIDVAGSVRGVDVPQILRTVGSHLLRWGLGEQDRSPFVGESRVEVHPGKR